MFFLISSEILDEKNLIKVVIPFDTGVDRINVDFWGYLFIIIPKNL